MLASKEAPRKPLEAILAPLEKRIRGPGLIRDVRTPGP
jgi:hypothetical protein